MEVTAINLDSTTLALLDASAKMRDLSREDTVREAIEQMRADDLLLEAAVKEGRDCIERGDFYTQEQVEANNVLLREEIMSPKCR